MSNCLNWQRQRQKWCDIAVSIGNILMVVMEIIVQDLALQSSFKKQGILGCFIALERYSHVQIYI